MGVEMGEVIKIIVIVVLIIVETCRRQEPTSLKDWVHIKEHGK